MKRRIFSILFALVLVASFSLVTAVPVGAVAADAIPKAAFTVNNATAAWSPEEIDEDAGDYSVELRLPVGRGSYAIAQIFLPEGTTLADLTGMSYKYFVDTLGSDPVDVGGIDVKGVGTQFEPVYQAPHLSIQFSVEGTPGGIVQHEVAVLTGDVWAVDTIEATEMWHSTFDAQNHTFAEYLGLYGDAVVPSVCLQLSKNGVPEAADPVAALSYVDTITIGEVVYDLEPRVINTDTSEGFNTIQDAIDDEDTDAGDTISVAAGTYTENVVVNKSLTLNGANAGVNAVTGQRGDESTIDGVTGHAVSITASTIVLDGFTITITDPDADAKSCGVCISRDATGVTVQNNIIRDISGGKRYGILLWGYTGDSPSSIDILNNAISGIEEYGIAINDASSDVTVDGNSITDIIQSTVIKNDLLRLRCIGISLGGQHVVSDVTISNNTISGVTGSGTGATGDDADGVGIWFKGTFEAQGTQEGVTVTSNDILNNTVGIAVSSGTVLTDTPAVHSNNIAGNTQFGIQNNLPGSPVDAAYNWWGDVSGPQHETMWQGQVDSQTVVDITNPGGIGDSVSDYVQYLPWLTRDFQTVLDDNIAYIGIPMVRLDTGWNTFSTPIALDPGETIDGVTYPAANTWGDYVALGDKLNIHATSPAYAFNPTVTPPWVPLNGDNADYPLKPCDAIYVRMAEPDIAPILFSPDVSVPTKEVYQGWNLIGPASHNEMPVHRALESLYKVPGDYTGYSQVVSPPLNQEPWVFVRGQGLDGPLMCPTNGYWVFMENGPDTLAGFTFTPIALD